MSELRRAAEVSKDVRPHEESGPDARQPFALIQLNPPAVVIKPLPSGATGCWFFFACVLLCQTCLRCPDHEGCQRHVFATGCKFRGTDTVQRVQCLSVSLRLYAEMADRDESVSANFCKSQNKLQLASLVPCSSRASLQDGTSPPSAI